MCFEFTVGFRVRAGSGPWKNLARIKIPKFQDAALVPQTLNPQEEKWSLVEITAIMIVVILAILVIVTKYPNDGICEEL